MVNVVDIEGWFAHNAEDWDPEVFDTPLSCAIVTAPEEVAYLSMADGERSIHTSNDIARTGIVKRVAGFWPGIPNGISVVGLSYTC